MAKQLLKTTLSIITLAACAQTALAASPNQNNGGGGSNCPPGTIGVLDNGVWDCVEQTIKPQSGATMSTATMGAKKYSPSKPPRAKPDLTVTRVVKGRGRGGSNTVDVYVKNQGSSMSKGGKLQVHTAAEVVQESMGDIKAGETKKITVKFDNPVVSGQSVTTADVYKKINESNEKNNSLTVNI